MPALEAVLAEESVLRCGREGRVPEEGPARLDVVEEEVGNVREG